MHPPPIRVENLVKSFGQRRVVDQISFTVEAGTCFGILGPNGAGKTTTVEMLEGLSLPTSGTIELFGKAWSRDHENELRERIGVQLQDSQLADKLTVSEVISLFRSFYGRGPSVSELISLVGLESETNARFHTLSGGQKQRVALATALVGAPDLLFLDEPTTGLDPRARQSLWTVVESFREGGGTIVLTTHYMDEAASLCDEIAIMDLGRIIARGSPRALIDSLGEVQFVEFETHAREQLLERAKMSELLELHSIEQRRGRFRITMDRKLSSLGRVLSELERLEVVPVGLSTHQATLDDVFLHLTGKELTDV